MNKRYDSKGYDLYKYGRPAPCSHVWEFEGAGHGVERFRCARCGNVVRRNA